MSRNIAKDDPRWVRLEKVWLEEGLSCDKLAQRFGISKGNITRRLKEKYGSAISPGRGTDLKGW